jgi:hypothetical protein
MRNLKIAFLTLTALFAAGVAKLMSAEPGQSFYPLRPEDPEAVYFTPGHFPVTADGKTDVSAALQQAIDDLKREKNFGIVFIPEGTYRITRTIYVPKAIRLIGYGKERPVIFLAKNSPGFQEEVNSDKGRAAYMFWFTDRIAEPGREPPDAGAGTFYSAISNINLEIRDGNPYAVALRTHFAQHSYVSHVDIHAGKGKAGLYDVGNEMEDVRFFGGEYGIYTTKTSPGWPMMMVDTWFEGQRRAAIFSQEGGLTIVRLHAENVPAVIEVRENYSDKLFLEDCTFRNVSGPAITVSNELNPGNQISMRNVVCEKVPVLVRYRRSGTETTCGGKAYLVEEYSHGLHMRDMESVPEMRTVVQCRETDRIPGPAAVDIPPLPSMESWVNLKDLGAVGDDSTDNTEVFRQAIENYSNIYIPQGWYVVSEPLQLKENTCLIGLHPIATQIKLKESTPAFSGFGGPVPLIETPRGGTNIITGIGINTGGYNYRAVGCKWQSGEGSLMNDVKFVGGHGSMNRGPGQPWRGRGGRRISTPEDPVTYEGKDRAWDNQYWSLWVTGGGGGTFKDIWTASSYCANGVYVSNTSTPGRIYAMSVELQECSDMVFANLYMFRVIRMTTPFPCAIRSWDCRDIEFYNVHNFSQIKFTTDLPLYDINTGIEVRPWEFTRLTITGNEKGNGAHEFEPGAVEKLATGFEFAEGITRDSHGNIYFCEQRMRRIYRWDAEKEKLSLLADFPWQPLSLGCDTRDNLLVVFRYDPQPGLLINGEPERAPRLPDAGGTSFSMWGNTGFSTLVYSMDPDNPEESIGLLPRVPMGSVEEVAKALYPSNRWRDFHDFNEMAVYVPESCFVAPDGKTIIPEVYDLARSSALLEAVPGKSFYAADEYDCRTVKMEVDSRGILSSPEYFTETGEAGSAVDRAGNLYVAAGQVYVFGSDGNSRGLIRIPERPSALQFGGKEGTTLFVTARSSLYGVRIPE